MNLADEVVQVRSNLTLTCRERGKIAARREGHNIWLDLGRFYLARLISGERTDIIQYMGFGIGGTRQIAPAAADALTAYPTVGARTQTDTDPLLSGIERPVRLSGGTTITRLPGDVWLGAVSSPTHPSPTHTLFSRLFYTSDISYTPFASVPLSEVGLFTSLADIHVAPDPSTYNSPYMVAYDTFDSLTKTSAFELQVNWTIRF